MSFLRVQILGLDIVSYLYLRIIDLFDCVLLACDLWDYWEYTVHPMILIVSVAILIA